MDIKWPMDDEGLTPFDVAVEDKNLWGCKLLIDYLSGNKFKEDGSLARFPW